MVSDKLRSADTVAAQLSFVNTFVLREINPTLYAVNRVNVASGQLGNVGSRER